MQNYLKNIAVFLFCTGLLISCGEVNIPKPYGYFRVDLPVHGYRKTDTLNLPFSFDLAEYAVLEQRNEPGEKFWIDLHYPNLNANIYCSYKSVNNNLVELTEDPRRYVYKHSIKADGLGEKVFVNAEKDMYGILYDIEGNTASSLSSANRFGINFSAVKLGLFKYPRARPAPPM